ncbi:MAG TPA: phosphonate utilization associated transcriptional regulator [Steroidobacteraceae bacterium]|nr:phosphonate utilization associated transcriptional regulator [Steroidobacteraceae bacterium]
MQPSNAPSPLEIFQANSLPSLIQAEIEQMILRGDLRPQQRINEVELAQRFRTSRGPVREALRALEECGLVRAERNRGTFVREVSLAEADEVYDVREALDDLIGRRLAERISPPQLAELRRLLEEMDGAVNERDIKRYHKLNLQFHDALVEFAGNARLTETYRRLTKELLLFRLHGLQEGGGFEVSNAEHKAIVKAIASRDPERAGRTLRAHAADSRARMHKAAGKGAGSVRASAAK